VPSSPPKTTPAKSILKKSNSRSGDFSVSFATARTEDGEREVMVDAPQSMKENLPEDWNQRFHEVLEKNRSKLILPGNLITREEMESKYEQSRNPDEQWEEIEEMYDSISKTIPSHIPHKIWHTPLSDWLKSRLESSKTRSNRKRSKVEAMHSSGIIQQLEETVSKKEGLYQSLLKDLEAGKRRARVSLFTPLTFLFRES
jgi:hypothetical protein